MDDAGFTEKSYWLTTRPYDPGPALEGDIDVDVAIIGGGYTGLTSAYFLKQAEPGLRVALLEAEVAGFGASGRNGGFSMTKIGMMHSITALRFGKLRAIEAHEYAERAVGLVQDLVGELGFDCDDEHPGYLWVATSEKLRRRLYKEIEFVHRLGIRGINLIDAHELRQRIHSPLYVGGGWWEPNCGLLNPAKLAWCWRDAIASRGVDVFERTPVTEVARQGPTSMLRTPKGRVRAGKVVYATNAWSHHFSELESKQVPVWTYIVLTEPLNDRQREAIGWRNREGVEDFRDLVHYYRLSPDDRIVWGGRRSGARSRHGQRPQRGDLREAAQRPRGDLSRARWHRHHPRVGRARVGAARPVPGTGLRRREGPHLRAGMRRTRRIHHAPARADRPRSRARAGHRPDPLLLRQPADDPAASRAAAAAHDRRHRFVHAMGGPSLRRAPAMKRCHLSDSPARTKLGPVGPQLSWSAQSSVCELAFWDVVREGCRHPRRRSVPAGRCQRDPSTAVRCCVDRGLTASRIVTLEARPALGRSHR
jgi:glycine/D-amino acid oxidase-like deaminating enzyme